MSKETHPHPFIVVEGPDGAGKSVQARLLAVALGAALEVEPATGPIGALLRKMLAAPEPSDPNELSALFAADRAVHRFALERLLAERPVVCDRYDLSSIIYQGGSSESARQWIRDLNGCALRPHLVLVLDVSFGVCAERLSAKGRLDWTETPERQAVVHELYWRAAEFTNDDLLHVDGNGAVEDVAARMLAAYRVWAAAWDMDAAEQALRDAAIGRLVTEAT